MLSHVVILGAGATIAAIPNGDKNGIESPAMNDFSKKRTWNTCLKISMLKPHQKT